MKVFKFSGKDSGVKCGNLNSVISMNDLDFN